MKTIVHRRFGESEVLTAAEVGPTVPRDDCVLIRMATAGDWAAQLAKSLGAEATEA